MTKCDRCGKLARITTTSWFNLDTICPACDNEEREHPDYQYAKQVENDAVRRGNYNFEGVGWPGVDGRVRR